MAKRTLTKRPDGWLARAEVDGVEYSRTFAERQAARRWLSQLQLKQALSDQLRKEMEPR